ncbi:MAG: ABC transporter permease [Treponema sp.]|nr:ABC transporter permease [Treponema sp.]
MKRNRLSSIRWMTFISNRFSKVDGKGRTAVTSTLSSLGICFGVMALTVVISVMNGFQMEFIDAIMEISSYHIRVSDVGNGQEFESWCESNPMIVSAEPFYEAQGLMISTNGKESAALVRAVDAEVMERDAGFAREVHMVSGDFDLSDPDSIVLGNDLARTIGARVGGSVNIYALSGTTDVSLISQDRQFYVTGIFYSNYGDINSAYSFVSLEAGEKQFGSGARKIYGIKLKDSERDSIAISRIAEAFPESSTQSWRSYNRTFFGALRIEKNMLMMLVFLIFVVVAINIYNGMRRMVYERREDISVLSALGGTRSQIQWVFIMKGFMTGLKGAVPGLMLGLLVTVNMEKVFLFLSKAQFWIQYFFMMIVNPANADMVQENPMFSVYANIPARMVLSEIVAIFLFGILSSLVAAGIASRQILHLTVAEVLHDD